MLQIDSLTSLISWLSVTRAASACDNSRLLHRGQCRTGLLEPRGRHGCPRGAKLHQSACNFDRFKLVFPVQVSYVFPLDEGCAVTKFECVMSSGTITCAFVCIWVANCVCLRSHVALLARQGHCAREEGREGGLRDGGQRRQAGRAAHSGSLCAIARSLLFCCMPLALCVMRSPRACTVAHARAPTLSLPCACFCTTQDEPDVFTVRIGNLLSDETCTVRLTYVTEIKVLDCCHVLRVHHRSSIAAPTGCSAFAPLR